MTGYVNSGATYYLSYSKQSLLQIYDNYVGVLVFIYHIMYNKPLTLRQFTIEMLNIDQDNILFYCHKTALLQVLQFDRLAK